jgi:hypothetical protein
VAKYDETVQANIGMIEMFEEKLKWAGMNCINWHEIVLGEQRKVRARKKVFSSGQ